MRRLLIKSPNHPFLESDIRAFEQAWFRRAAQFAQTFAKGGRSDVIAEVLRDLEREGYLEAVPDGLSSQLRALLVKAQATQFTMLAKEIRQAFADRSTEKLTLLAERWNALVELAGPPAADVSFGLAEAFNWARLRYGG